MFDCEFKRILKDGQKKTSKLIALKRQQRNANKSCFPYWFSLSRISNLSTNLLSNESSDVVKVFNWVYLLLWHSLLDLVTKTAADLSLLSFLLVKPKKARWIFRNSSTFLLSLVCFPVDSITIVLCGSSMIVNGDVESCKASRFNEKSVRRNTINRNFSHHFKNLPPITCPDLPLKARRFAYYTERQRKQLAETNTRVALKYSWANSRKYSWALDNSYASLTRLKMLMLLSRARVAKDN